MKKSIAFLGALLFGSVTFGQVTKNDSIKKPSSRKVSADDLKKFPADTETTATDGHIKIESSQKHIKYNRTEKYSSDNDTGKVSKINGVTQKGKVDEAVVEKQSSTPISPFKGGEIQKTKANENQTIEKKHVSNIKWSGDKVKNDSVPTPTSKTSGNFLKIGDIKGEK